MYTLLPFPMKFNGSIVTVDTDITPSTNYILSINCLKESIIVNDDLLNCKKTNVDLYLCSTIHFTFNEALSHSCAASLVKNISIAQNCHFKEENPTPRHETVQDSLLKFSKQDNCVRCLPSISTSDCIYRRFISCTRSM